MMNENSFVEIAAILGLATLTGIVGQKLRQPLIIMFLASGILAGLTVAQISEFSLIVATLGLSIGHITEQTMGLITLVGVVTIFLSTYMILYSYPL